MNVVQLVAVAPGDLRTVWGYFRANLVRTLSKGAEPWIPEDVYSDIMAGKAAAFLVKVDGEVTGGVVTTAREDTLHVWVLWEKTGNVAKVMEEVRTMAKAAGFRYGTFETSRRGWEKLAPKLGFRPRTWIQEV